MRSEELRLRCLELAINTPDRVEAGGDPFRLARKFYAFVKEKDGENVVHAVPFLTQVNSPSKR
jgi:hypothetical protein